MVQTKNYLSLNICLFLSTLLGIIYCQEEMLEEQTKSKILQTVQYKYLIFTTHCYDTFFIHDDWFHFDCLKMTAIKLLGYGLVMGGAIIKLPQIIKILRLNSVKGISFTSVIFELSTNILATGYCLYKNNPFSLYGENVFIGIQMLLIILLFGMFGTGNKSLYGFCFVAMLVASYYVSDPHHLPSFVVEHSIVVQTLLICTSRLSQIYEVTKIKSTGSLALITWVLTVLGNIARIATIASQASHDYKFLLSIVTVAVLNGYILFQFYLYREIKPKTD